jgi:hypothetical protein
MVKGENATLNIHKPGTSRWLALHSPNDNAAMARNKAAVEDILTGT